MKLVTKKGNLVFTALVTLMMVLLCVSFVLMPHASAQTSMDADWPIYRHDAAHTGYSETSAPTSAPLLWSRTVDADAASAPSAPDLRARKKIPNFQTLLGKGAFSPFGAIRRPH